jgi:hypothetical protein
VWMKCGWPVDCLWMACGWAVDGLWIGVDGHAILLDNNALE